ncbi:ABC transporter ATP-binding protein [Streptococcus ratti]|uniref:ABC transporter, ATP-binding protein n=1 Tax=Streptococcus ratti FA-1 = DSM 20564 TaxID=699248 RepID=A0ABN0GRZ3_STRRT|nr:ABC transporter ATP-binding protein [Streptococcus ratti]EJN93186.1 putative ABC transporter, ATP-binding protein [Streptococcus ratti FA-1 = DSM 20564]EMP70089.1 ABC transporter ATP-binding protein [Streptococcus ratti FA-1 = DSM 20564]QEY06845.1 ABC transporter ATP-binding protein [Streptococcus ratti]VEI59259.1 ABC transporter ATP-binding protein [Streptococcus mutans]
MEKLLNLQALRKNFGKQVVLNEVSFELDPGEIIGLIGPSGAGKSTMIKTMLGMEKADSGDALVLSHRMPNRHVLGEIGYMAQSDALYESLSGLENMEFFAQMKGLSRRDIPEAISHACQVVDLSEHLNKAVSGYSGGMKRRLSLAIALLGNPRLLILDEPTVGIDPALRRKVWQELHQLKKDGVGILLTTHVMDEAELTDKVGLLLNGRMIAFDSPENLKSAYAVDSIEDVFLKAEGEL